MTSIDIESLLLDVSAEYPAGEDLEYDPEFIQLDRLTAKKAERAIDSPGQEVEQIDWKAAARASSTLLARTKDLRLAVLLTRALVHTEGFQGLSDGLSLILQLMDRFWDSLHPQLDHEDGNDPTMRMNSVANLCDRESLIQPLLDAPLVSIKGWGAYSLQNVRSIDSTPASEGGNEEAGINPGEIRAAFMECPIEELKVTADAVVASQSTLASIDQLIMEKVGSSHAPDLGELDKTLREVLSTLNAYLEIRGEVTPGVAEDGPDTRPAQAISGEINSRESAIKMMEKISDYFRKAEPSSPVPLLMQRAKRLSTMGFMEIVRDIAPDGLQQVQNISGTEPD